MQQEARKQADAGKPRTFSEMTGLEKLKFIGKVIVFVATGGFAFPTIFND